MTKQPSLKQQIQEIDIEQWLEKQGYPRHGILRLILGDFRKEWLGLLGGVERQIREQAKTQQGVEDIGYLETTDTLSPSFLEVCRKQLEEKRWVRLSAVCRLLFGDGEKEADQK